MREIIVEKEASGLAQVTIDRPEKRNAVNLVMWAALRDTFGALEADPAVRVVVLTGAGGHFSAGADISEFDTVRATEVAGRHYDEVSDGAEDAIQGFSKPTVAAIDGVCVGGGLGLALCCDIRVASAAARFGITAARLGIVYGLPETRKLFDVAGAAAAKRILLGADIFDAAEARSLGLLKQVVEGEALPAARAFAEGIASNAPISMAGAKTILAALAAGEAEAREAEFEALVLAALDSEDYGEGRRAFAEKRRPTFTGR